ncbi:CMD domain-containing protein [Martelella radicis]|uniref:Uncharacterized protein YciW n=1 Tax=Martelella radicis TaxID=1397476 RepID=A0A7W6KKJ4_9HYPH|nr:CMD domain protein [Martelella radicis]MBB4122822.1 uncharacterized protein YciW [Martelella radicis]
MVDVIDKVLGEDADMIALRNRRELLKQKTQASYEAALTPKEAGNFSYAMRAALAARMCALWKAAELEAHYRDLLESYGETAFNAIPDPGFRPGKEDLRLDAILQRVDKVTLTPKEATRADVEKLYAAGLDDRDIVTLASLTAFVNYQVLVVAGLKMLRDH